jgi:hypothetical protein
MIMKLTVYFSARIIPAMLALLFLVTQVEAGNSAPKIDPIRFSMSTTATEISLNEEFEIEIKANYLSIPNSAAFVFQGANAFRIRVIFPDGFQQTGGNFSDFATAQLSPQKPFIKYNIKGKFTSESGDGIFQLLRSHSEADNQSTFIQVATLPYKINLGGSLAASDQRNARIQLAQVDEYVPNLTIAQLRAGAAGTATTVFITDTGKSGTFKYNATSTAADDGAIIIVTGSKRYERVYSGAVNVNWFGIFADGTTDHSVALQKILNNDKYRNVFFPKATTSYRIKTIRIYSNSTLTFEDGTVVEGTGTLGTYERMITIYDASNIIIKGINCVFKDHRENYSSGQFRHIFSIEGATNVSIEGMSAENGGGDGFYIGAASIKKFSENVKLINVRANNNRRQGITVVSGKNIEMTNPVASNSNGEAPGSGIDIEPSMADFILEGIKINNPKTSGNVGPGIIISPGALVNTGKTVDIVVSNHEDDASAYGLLVSTVKGPLAGSVTISNAIWKNSRFSAFVARNWSDRGPVVKVQQSSVINANTSAQTSPNLGAAYLVYRQTNDTGDTNLGNIQIIGAKIQDSPRVTTSFCFRDLLTGSRIKNCSVIDPVKVGTVPYKNLILHNAEVTVSDTNKAVTTDFGSYNKAVGIGYYTPWYHNQNSSAIRTLTLEKMNANFPQVTVEVKAGYAVRIAPFSTDNILPLSPTNGKVIRCAVVGSRITFKKTSDNSWTITEMVGPWAVEP